MSGVGDRINPRTGQMRVAVNEDLAQILFEGQSIDSGAEAVSDAIDVEADIEKTLFIKTAQSFQIQVQLTDDDSANPEWYDLCNTSGVAVNFTALFSPGRAIPISCKARKMRVWIKNTDAAADTPYIGVM